MDMRQYDPSIARWVVQDPVIHHSMSPYNAFDNNPVYWADPSGATPVVNGRMDVSEWSSVINKGFYTDNFVDFSFNDGMKPYQDGGGGSDDGTENKTNDDIIFYSIDSDGNKKEIGRLTTTEFIEEFSVAETSLPEFILNMEEPIVYELDVNSLLDTQAISLDISGEVAYKFGVQYEISIIGILKGEDAGKIGVTQQLNGLIGLEAGITGSFSKYKAVSGSLSLSDLQGWEMGLQGSGASVGVAYFEGFKYTSSYPFMQTVYTGESIGGSIGALSTSFAGSAYIGYSSFIYP